MTVWTLNSIDPGGEPIELSLDNLATRKLDAVAVYREYETMVADGTLQEIQGYNREVEKARLMENLVKDRDRVRKKCQYDVQVSVEWKTVTDELLKPNPHRREPYALARDQRGTYYYVDRSIEKNQKHYFKLYVGKLGNVRLQRMKDIVSDSEGDIFVSKKGKLRLILGKSQASWIRGRKRTKLTLVPIDENLPMIYNELGPYIGERLGNPCDDYGVE